MEDTTQIGDEFKAIDDSGYAIVTGFKKAYIEVLLINTNQHDKEPRKGAISYSELDSYWIKE